MSPDECRRIFESLSEYLDGELPEDACQAIREHVAGCPPCVEFVDSLRRSIDVYRNHAAANEPAPLAPAEREQLAAAYRAMLARRSA